MIIVIFLVEWSAEGSGQSIRMLVFSWEVVGWKVVNWKIMMLLKSYAIGRNRRYIVGSLDHKSYNRSERFSFYEVVVGLFVGINNKYIVSHYL